MKFERTITLLIFIGLSAFYFATWRSVNPNLTDFPQPYAAARLQQAGKNPYDLEAQCNVQREIRSDLCMPFNHTPLLLPVISLISNEDYESSYTRWCFLLVVVLGLCFVPALFISSDLDASLQSLLFLPILISVTQGQDTAFILLSVFLFTALLTANKDLLAGIALTLALLKPHIALLLAIPTLFSRPKAFFGFFMGSLVATVFGLYLVGISGYRGLLELMMLTAAGGKQFGVNHFDMYSAAGLFARAGVSHLFVWPVFVLALVGISALWRKRGTSIHNLCVGNLAATFASPHLLLHDLALLAIPVYLIHPFAPVLATVILLSSHYVGLRYAGAHLVMIVAALFHVARMSDSQSDKRANL